MSNSFYIPIQSGSLAHYYGGALIIPAKYLSNKPEDIQNNFSSSILLSKVKWVNGSDCTLEVVLTEMEVKELKQISDTFYLLNNPLPISRIKSIFFLEDTQKVVTIWNINSGTAFIPESLISIESSKPLNFVDIELERFKHLNQEEISVDLADKIKRFDKILGAFAFMRLGGKPFLNYSFNYFATLAYFNKLIEEQTKNAENNLGLKFSNKYWGLFSKEIEGEWTPWLPFILKNLSSDDVLNLAQSQNLHAETNNLGLLKLDSIDSSTHLFDLAILATYGEDKSKSVDDLVTDLFNGKIDANKFEDISILFGLNLGYTKLYNKYKTTNSEYQVKFDLQSKLDYYIIESLFQFAFNRIKSNTTFDYIDKWCPLNTKSTKYKDYETYTIIDVDVVAKKRQSVLDFFFENYSESIYSSVVKSINQWLPPFAEINKKGATQYFENNLRSILAVSVEAIQSRIKSEFDEQYNLHNTETIESQKKEINKLLDEISLLKQENENLNIEILSFSRHKPDPEVIIGKGYTIEDTAWEAIDSTSIVQEPETEFSVDYESMSFPELQKFAKVNKVKGYTTCKKKEDLIAQIKKAQKAKEAQKRQQPLL